MQGPDCIVCRKHLGIEPIPGGAIYEDDVIFSSHSPLIAGESSHYLGHLFVEPKRHIPGLADLTDEEAQAIAVHSTRLARALLETVGVVHVYSFIIGDGVPHLHVHLIGRYPGAPRQYWGPKVDEWPDAPRGGEDEIAELNLRLRVFFQAQGE